MLSSQKLQAQQEARQQLQFAVRVMDNQAALLNDADTPAFGPENAKVAVIEFLGSAWKTENILR